MNSREYAQQRQSEPDTRREGLPRPPELDRKIDLARYQWFALPLLFCVPILALFGVLGETYTTTTVQQNGVEMVVNYANRAHYEANNQVSILIRNNSGRDLTDATLEVERAFLDRFSQINFNPSLSIIMDSVYRIELGDLASGTSRVVTIGVQPDHMGDQRGSVALVVAGEPVASVELAMFVFP